MEKTTLKKLLSNNYCFTKSVVYLQSNKKASYENQSSKKDS